MWACDARPIELGEQIRLARISVGETHRITASTVKGVPEMQNLSPAFAVTSLHVLAHLPIHRCLQTILDCERTTFDEKITLQRRQTDYAFKGLDKFRVALRVNVRVGDFDFRGPQEIALHIIPIEVRMIKSDRHRTEKSVQIDQAASACRVI